MIKNELEITEKSVIELKDYLSELDYEKILSWFYEYKNYLLTFNDYHFIHGDLWYENYILDDNNELVGMVDFECSGMWDPAYDIAALYYLGTEFVNKVLSYYKYTDENLTKRIPLLIKAREITSFYDIVKNHPEEIEEQIDKIIRKVE